MLLLLSAAPFAAASPLAGDSVRVFVYCDADFQNLRPTDCPGASAKNGKGSCTNILGSGAGYCGYITPDGIGAGFYAPAPRWCPPNDCWGVGIKTERENREYSNGVYTYRYCMTLYVERDGLDESRRLGCILLVDEVVGP